MPGKQLTVTSLSSNKLAYSNAIFVNPAEASQLGNYVQINDHMVFVVRPDEAIPAGEVALNKCQRACTKSSNGLPVSVQRWEPTANLKALSARFEINTFKDKRFVIKEDDVVPLVERLLVDFALTADQTFIADLNGINVTLTVKSLQVAKGETDSNTSRSSFSTVYSSIGIFSAQTEIEVDACADNKKLKFEKSANSRSSPLFKPDWKFADMGIGGLDAEFSAIFRRSFASRLFPPDTIAQLGIKHVKGMLLYGPPGTGKTLIARQIGKMLAGKEPKIVNGPEILNKYVGASEENIRKLFADAEADYAANKEAAELHIVIFDEIDAICKQRGSNRGGTGVHDTIVNQLLTKIDGVDSPNNLLVIGMTNRKDMIDPALLRPGRLEVHVEIGLPDEAGRVDVFKIHTRKMMEAGYMDPNVDLQKLAEMTKNYSGAEIEGVVKGASSYALYGTIDVTKGDGLTPTQDSSKKIMVTMDDFLASLGEMTPVFGVETEELKTLTRGELITWGSPYVRVVETLKTLRSQVGDSESTPLLSVLLEGVPNSGKTAIIAKMAMESDFPFIKLVSAETLLGYDERTKCDKIQKIFEDAYKSPKSLIIIDEIERLLEYVPIGPRFSNPILQCLQVLVRRLPAKEDCKLLIMATTSNSSMLEDMDFKQAFNVILKAPQLTKAEEVKTVITEAGVPLTGEKLEDLAVRCPLPIPIKNLLMVLEMAKQRASANGSDLDGDIFTACVVDAGLGPGY